MDFWYAKSAFVDRSLQGRGSGSRKHRPYFTNDKLVWKVGKKRSNDFLETDIWAPDLPTRQPSPSSTTWANNVHISETSCSKNFNTHSAFSPGTFGGYCLCRHAKTIIVSFLKWPEGFRMPLSLIEERCSTLPKYVVYDFAWGTQRAATALPAEISKHVRFVIDPFHFLGQKTCALGVHQANYPDLKWLNVESQEQRNSRIRIMEWTSRANRDIHFMHFVVLAHGYLNIKATYLDHHDLSDDGDIGTKTWLKWVRENLF